jgi:hypothetical protein
VLSTNDMPASDPYLKNFDDLGSGGRNIIELKSIFQHFDFSDISWNTILREVFQYYSRGIRYARGIPYSSGIPYFEEHGSKRLYAMKRRK